MTPTPFHDFASRVRWSAVNGKKCHLEVDVTAAIAQHPELQALIGRIVAEETARLCHASADHEQTSDSPDLFSSPAPRRATPAAPPPPAASASDPAAASCGSNGAPSGGSISSLGTIAPLVQDAASQQASDQAQATILLAKRTKHLQRATPSAPAPPHRRHRPRPVSA